MDGCDTVSVNTDSLVDSFDNSNYSSYSESDNSSITSYSSSYSSYSEDDYSIIDEDDHENPETIEVLSSRCDNSQPNLTTPPVWYEQYVPRPASIPSTRRTIRRDNRFEKCDMLPTVSVPNTRSIFPKINNFVQDMRMRSISLALTSETWHRESKKRHKNDIERLLNMEGMKFISAARGGGRRGGGCGIIADLTDYTLDQLDIPNPDKVEMFWGILRPQMPEDCAIKEYLVGAFYCPPNSKKKEKLTNHILTNAHILMSRYPNAGLYIGGDKNSLDLSPILQGLPRCRQIVAGNTHDNKCLDILITNLHNLYQPPVIVPGVLPDDRTKGKASDHLVPIAYPISNQSGSVSRLYQVKTTRPMPESGMREFGHWLANEEWIMIDSLSEPDLKEQQFTNQIEEKLSEIFPSKSVKISNHDLPFINGKLKKMKRKVQRLYKTPGRQQEYENLLAEYQAEFQKTSEEYIRVNVSELKETNPSKAAAILKRLGGAPGDCQDTVGFTILSHQEENLSPEESTDRILTYFTNISKEFSPLDVSALPVRVKVKLLDKCVNVPTIEDYQVYNAIKGAKKPKSAGVPGDLPRKLLKEFPVELAKPVASLFRSIMKTNKWRNK